MRLFSRFSSVKQKSSDCFKPTANRSCSQKFYIFIYLFMSCKASWELKFVLELVFKCLVLSTQLSKYKKKMFGLAFTGERKQKMFTLARWNCNFILVLLHGVFSFHSWSFIFTRSSSWQHHNSFSICRFVLSSTIFMHFCRAGCTKQDIFHLFSVIFGHRKRI